MSRVHILLIPVYAESFEKQTKYIDALTHRRKLKMIADFARYGGVPDPERLKQIEYEVEAEEGPWRTNRMVGFFDIEVNDGQIEINVYKHDSRSFSRRPALRYRAHGFRVASLGTGDPVEVSAEHWLVGTLKEQKEVVFKTRFVDWSALEALLSHTNLRELMKGTLRKTR